LEQDIIIDGQRVTLLQDWHTLCSEELDQRNISLNGWDSWHTTKLTSSYRETPIKIIGRDFEVVYESEVLRGEVIRSIYWHEGPGILIVVKNLARCLAVKFERPQELPWQQVGDFKCFNFVCWGDRLYRPRLLKNAEIYMELWNKHKYRAWVRKPGDHLTFDVLRDRRFGNRRSYPYPDRSELAL